jgi:arginase
VIHIGQRDWDETREYGSQDIRETSIRCFDFATIKKNGVESILDKVLTEIALMKVEGLWIHFDTDVLSE